MFRLNPIGRPLAADLLLAEKILSIIPEFSWAKLELGDQFFRNIYPDRKKMSL
jgi:hypothetical protein